MLARKYMCFYAENCLKLFLVINEKGDNVYYERERDIMESIVEFKTSSEGFDTEYEIISPVNINEIGDIRKRQIAKEIINLFDFCPLILYNSLSTKPILMGYNLEL